MVGFIRIVQASCALTGCSALDRQNLITVVRLQFVGCYCLCGTVAEMVDQFRTMAMVDEGYVVSHYTLF